MADYPLARIDKSGDYPGHFVICGARNCTDHLALIRETDDAAELYRLPEEVKERLLRMPPLRYLHIRPGYVLGADGVWALSTAARKDLAAGRRPLYRDIPRHTSAEKTAQDLANAPENARLLATDAQVVCDLPALVKCPGGHISRLDPERLQVSPFRRLPGTRLYLPLR